MVKNTHHILFYSSVCLVVCFLHSCIDQMPLSHEGPVDESLSRLYLKMGQENVSTLMKSIFLDRWFPVIIDRDSGEQSAMIRIHGKLSRHYPKKTFKIKSLSGYPEKITEVYQLSSQYSDDSYCRYRLAQQFFRRAGLLCSQVEPVHLYFDNRYNGIYLKIEYVDALFFQKRNLPLSSLYKVNRFASLSSLSGVPPQGAFSKKLPKNDMTYFDIERLFKLLDKGITCNDTNELERLIDVDNVLNYYAVAVMIGHGDGITSNYYLYYNGSINKFQFIPWDLDLTFYNNPSITTPYINNLFEQLLKIERYNTYVTNRMKEIFHYQELDSTLNHYAEEVRVSVFNDPWLTKKRNKFDDQVENIHWYLSRLRTLLTSE